MRKEISLSAAKGKTIEGFASSITCRQMVITFTDNTFTTLGLDRGYDPGDEEIVEDTLSALNFGHEKLVKLGITTEAELEELSAKRKEAHRSIRLQQEKELYERLKAKFN